MAKGIGTDQVICCSIKLLVRKKKKNPQPFYSLSNPPSTHPLNLLLGFNLHLFFLCLEWSLIILSYYKSLSPATRHLPQQL